jgi:hypothetical protein
MGDIFLNPKEARRLRVMELLIEAKITASEAAVTLALSRRQILRLKKSFAEAGPSALAHSNRGRSPKHAIASDCKDRIVALARDEMKGASYSHMSELLVERHNICLSAKTIGRILKAAQVPHEHTYRARSKHRSRERMSQAGALVQMDASSHDWLEGRCTWLSLHGAIDDATGTWAGGFFALQECTHGYLEVVRQMCSTHGVPANIYTDRHTLFFSPKTDKLTIDEEIAGKTVRLTQFGAALDELGIHHIAARTPQAKGRVERLWGTLQERLTIEMRIEGISTLEEANAFLQKYMVRHNQRFAVKPVNNTKAWRKAPTHLELRNILCFRTERTVSNGSTISFQNKTCLLKDQGHVAALPSGTKVTVRVRLDNTINAYHQNKCYQLIAMQIPQRAALATNNKEEENQITHKQNTGTTPQPNHPWKRGLPPIRVKKGDIFTVPLNIE